MIERDLQFIWVVHRSLITICSKEEEPDQLEKKTSAGLEFEQGPQWSKASTLTIAQSMIPSETEKIMKESPWTIIRKIFRACTGLFLFVATTARSSLKRNSNMPSV